MSRLTDEKIKIISDRHSKFTENDRAWDFGLADCWTLLEDRKALTSELAAATAENERLRQSEQGAYENAKSLEESCRRLRTELEEAQSAFATSATDAQRALNEAHRVLDALKIPRAEGATCTHKDCNCLIVHRIYTLHDMYQEGETLRSEHKFLTGTNEHLNTENERLTRELGEAKRLISDEPQNKTLLPPFAQRLWESCNTLMEKAAFKQVFRHLGEVEKQLSEAQKQLAELRGGDGASHDELAEIAHETWAIPGTSLDHVAVAVADRVRAVERLRIAELERERAQFLDTGSDVLSSAVELKAAHDRLAAELAEAKEDIAYNKDYEAERHELAYELALAEEACGQLSDLVDELREKLDESEESLDGEEESHEETLDRLNAEYESHATTKQALADARGELERAVNQTHGAYSSVLQGLDAIAAGKSNEILDFAKYADLWREWARLGAASIRAVIKPPAPAKPAASEIIGLCPKCGIQSLTKEADDMIRLDEKDYLCGNCKRYLCRPIESNPAASGPADSGPFIVEAYWPYEDGTERWTKANGGFDTRQAAEEWAQAALKSATWRVVPDPRKAASDPAERRFVCPRCGGIEHVVSLGGHDNFGRFFPETVRCGELLEGGCGWSGTWAEVEAAKGEGDETPTVWYLVGSRENGEFYATEVWEDGSVAEDNAEEMPGEIVEVVAKSAYDAERQAREAETQRAERAEAAAGVMRSVLERLQSGMVSEYRLKDGAYPKDVIREALDVSTAHGRAANELRVLREIEKIANRRLIADADANAALTDIRGLLATLERTKALAGQGDQGAN